MNTLLSSADVRYGVIDVHVVHKPDLDDPATWQWGEAVKIDHGLVAIVMHDDPEPEETGGYPRWYEFEGDFAPFVVAAPKGIANVTLEEYISSGHCRVYG